MKSPQQLAQALARQWQRADWREQHLLPGPGQTVWPLALPIGLPAATTFLDDSTTLRQHLQQWQAAASSGIGMVAWQARSYRGGSEPVQVPAHWVLARPSDCVAAIARWGAERGPGKSPVPVYFIGIGEQLEDLQTFNAREFAEALLN